jgi:shikimate kinase
MGDQPARPVFLVGFMGAGKTTVGKVLAPRLNYEFIDLDDVIEKRMGMSVKAIFAQSGEAEFRRVESEVLESCREMSRTVIALGGGAYVAESNRELLREIGTTIWLDCPLAVCLLRLGDDPSRPVLGSKPEMEALLSRRRGAYVLADHAVEVGTATPEEVASEIVKLVRGD